MKQTWRWFGPDDPIGIDELLQSGVEGVVSSLHCYPPGEVWPVEAICQRQAAIACRADGHASGLAWDVVESLPVSESIKTQDRHCRQHVEHYKTSLTHLAACGITTVCYNFMPILDWTRTRLRAPMAHGGTAMAFDLLDFAVFDLYLLARPGAADDYPPMLIDAARQRLGSLDERERSRLCDNVVKGLPGANDRWTLDDIHRQLAGYRKIGAGQLRKHLVDFLAEVAPHAESLGIRLCCHPDDPPFSLLGLPRILSSESDYARVMAAVDLPANGITLCTGSLGVDPAFDAPGFVARLGSRIHFVHLRNTVRVDPAAGPRHSFHESLHLAGDTDIVATVAALLAEQQQRRVAGRADWQIPMRPDHGQDLLGDIERRGMPGYPLYGRMRGLAELRGVMVALSQQLPGVDLASKSPIAGDRTPRSSSAGSRHPSR